MRQKYSRLSCRLALTFLLVASLRVNAQQAAAPASAEQLTRAQKEEFLRTAKIVKYKPVA